MHRIVAWSGYSPAQMFGRSAIRRKNHRERVAGLPTPLLPTPAWNAGHHPRSIRSSCGQISLNRSPRVFF